MGGLQCFLKGEEENSYGEEGGAEEDLEDVDAPGVGGLGGHVVVGLCGVVVEGDFCPNGHEVGAALFAFFVVVGDLEDVGAVSGVGFSVHGVGEFDLVPVVVFDTKSPEDGGGAFFADLGFGDGGGDFGPMEGLSVSPDGEYAAREEVGAVDGQEYGDDFLVEEVLGPSREQCAEEECEPKDGVNGAAVLKPVGSPSDGFW